MSKKKVLFVCVHNSARSQMAEAYLKKLGGDSFIVESAGFEPNELNPLAVEAMALDNIDISKNRTKSVFDLFKEGRLYSYVITVCDESNSERCPIFPGTTKRVDWSFEDPSRFRELPYTEGLEKTIEVRDRIKDIVTKFVNLF